MKSEFSDIIKSKRSEKYTSARDFYLKNSVSCSYAYYSSVENGKVPEIEIALELIDKLSVNIRKALHAWTRDHMPSSELKALFSEMDDRPTLSSEQHSIERSQVVNRMQAKMLQKDPVYWEILVYMSSGQTSIKPSDKSISKVFNISYEKLGRYLNDLYDFGLLNKNAQGNYTSKEWIFIPYEAEFSSLRDLNFRRAFIQFGKAEESTRFRTTITAKLSPRHQQSIEAKVVALSNQIIDLSELESTEDSIPYTIGVFSSPRIFGND